MISLFVSSSTLRLEQYRLSLLDKLFVDMLLKCSLHFFIQISYVFFLVRNILKTNLPIFTKTPQLQQIYTATTTTTYFLKQLRSITTSAFKNHSDKYKRLKLSSLHIHFITPFPYQNSTHFPTLHFPPYNLST